MLDRISGLGTNLLLVRPGAPNQRGHGADLATLVPDDATAVAALPNVLAAVPEMSGNVTIRFGNADYQTQIIATSGAYPLARNWPVVRGTFFSDSDVRSYAAVVVLGQTVIKNLFPAGVDPIGKYVLINNVLFQVIGIMDARGATPWGADQDDVLIMPLTTGSMMNTTF